MRQLFPMYGLDKKPTHIVLNRSRHFLFSLSRRREMSLPPIWIFRSLGIPHSSFLDAIRGTLGKEMFHIWPELDISSEIDCL